MLNGYLRFAEEANVKSMSFVKILLNKYNIIDIKSNKEDALKAISRLNKEDQILFKKTIYKSAELTALLMFKKNPVRFIDFMIKENLIKLEIRTNIERVTNKIENDLSENMVKYGRFA